MHFHNRSVKVLPSTVNFSKETYDIVSGKQTNDLNQVVTMAMKKDNMTRHFAKRATVSKFKSIALGHNLCPDY